MSVRIPVTVVVSFGKALCNDDLVPRRIVKAIGTPRTHTYLALLPTAKLHGTKT